MATKLEFESSMNSAGFRAGLIQMERMAKQAAAGIESTITNASGSADEVILRKQATIKRRNREADEKRRNEIDNSQTSGGPGGLGFRRRAAGTSQLLHSLRATIDSLVSGQNPFRVFLQQAPQVAQALMQMGSASFQFAKNILLSPITWFVAGLATLLGVAIILARHYHSLAERQKNFNELTNLGIKTMADYVKGMQDAAEAHRKQIEWLEKHGAAQDELKKATESALKALREKAKFERELAGSQGATKMRLAQMDIAAAEAEVELLKQRAEITKAAHDKSMAEEKQAASDLEAFDKSDEHRQIEQGKTKLEEATKVADAIREKMSEAKITTGFAPGHGGSLAGVTSYNPIRRAANESDVFTVTVAGKEYSKSLNEAKAAVDTILSKTSELADKQKRLNDLVSNKQKLSSDQKAEYDRLNDEINNLESDLKLKQEYSYRIARAGSHSSAGRSGGDSLLNIGNFLGSARGKVESLAQKQADLMARYLPEIAQNTKPRSAGHWPVN